MKHKVRIININSTVTTHKCVDCNKQIPFGAKMKIVVVSTREKIHNDYYCMSCAEKHKELFEEESNV